jgi:hypothetical protein
MSSHCASTKPPFPSKVARAMNQVGISSVHSRNRCSTSSSGLMLFAQLV